MISLPISPTGKNRMNQSFAVGEYVPDEYGHFNARKLYQVLKTSTQMDKYNTTGRHYDDLANLRSKDSEPKFMLQHNKSTHLTN